MSDPQHAEIYGLFDPETDELRYIGKANNSTNRLKRHLTETNQNRPVCRWIGSLLAQRKCPTLKVLETVPHEQWEEAERRLIALYRKTGRLLNVADGGRMPAQTIEQRKLAGKASQSKLASNAPLRRVINSKMNAARLYNKFIKTKSFKHAALMRFMMRVYAADRPHIYGSWATL